MRNLIANSQMGACTAVVNVRIGSPITCTGWSSTNPGGGTASFTTSGGNGGLTAKKLFFVEGNGTPHAAFSGKSLTAAAGSAQTYATTRLTGATNDFTGVIAGNVFQNTGGTNTAPKVFYSIRAIDSVNHAWIEVCGGVSGDIMPHGTATYTGTFYEGGSAVDSTVNGVPATSPGAFNVQHGYPCQVASTATNTVLGLLRGKNDRGLNTRAALLWEVAPGDDGYDSGIACDNFKKSGTLKYWRTRGYDWDGTTVVTQPGETYGGKFQKGSASAEQVFVDLSTNAPFNGDRSLPTSAILDRFRGKNIVFGMLWKPSGSSTARPFIYDGTTTTYGSYFTTGSFNWQEVTATLSTTATVARVGVEITGSIGDYHYGTQPMADYGTSLGSYIPFVGTLYPTSTQGFVDYQPGAFSGTSNGQGYKNIRLEVDSLGTMPEGMTALNCYLEGCSKGSQTYLNSMTIEDSVNSYSPGSPIHQQADNSLVNFSTGLTTVLDGHNGSTLPVMYMGQGCVTTTESDVQFSMTYPGTFTGLFSNTVTSPTGTSFYTLRRNGADTALTAYIGGVVSAPPFCSDVDPTHAVDFSCGDLISLKLVTNGGVPTRTHRCSLRAVFNPTVNDVVQTSYTNVGIGALPELNTSGTVYSDSLTLNGFAAFSVVNIAPIGYVFQ